MGDGGAEWEYSFEDPTAGKLQVIGRCFTVGGRGYVISWTAPPYDFGNRYIYFDLTISGFSRG